MSGCARCGKSKEKHKKGCDNPDCKCDPCKCGDNCDCGKEKKCSECGKREHNRRGERRPDMRHFSNSDSINDFCGCDSEKKTSKKKSKKATCKNSKCRCNPCKCGIQCDCGKKIKKKKKEKKHHK